MPRTNFEAGNKEARNMRLQVLIEPSLYNELNNYAVEGKIRHKTDSELIRYCIIRFLDYELNVKLTMYSMKNQLDTQKEQLTEANKAIAGQQTRIGELLTECKKLEQINAQLKEKKKNENKTKPRKKSNK